MDMYVTFGGIGVSIKNEDKNNLIIDVYTKDEKGEWYITHTEYTSKPDIVFAVRGFENSPREFGVTIRDPWENKTEPVYTTVTPWYEVELDKGKFAEVLLPNDASMAYWGFSISRIWNGNYAYGANDMCHSSESEGWPQSFTFDLGVVAKLSRYKYWQRLQDDYIYQHGNLKKWELYGRSDTPPAEVLNRPDYLPAKYLQRTKHMLLPEKSSSFHRVHRLSVISAGKGSKHLPVPNSYISRK